MKFLFTLYTSLILSLFFGFGWRTDFQKPLDSSLAQPVHDISQPTEIIPLPIVQEMVGQVNQERALTDLKRLTGVEPICIEGDCYTITGRETGSTGLDWAKKYVREVLTNFNFSVEVMDWSRSTYSDQNILVRKQGLIYPNEEIYFIAHLDGYLAGNPAADDDASGVVSLLELARILKTHAFSRTVVLFFSTGEEHGALGVRSYIDQLTQEELNDIQYAVTVEMLGYDSDNDGAMQLWNGNQSVDFVQLLSDIITAYPIDLMPQIVSGCA